MTDQSETTPAAGQRWRHRDSGDEVVLRSRFGNNRGFYTRGPRDFHDGEEAQWEFVDPAPSIISITAEGSCDSCGGTGKGPPRSYEVDSNYNYVTTDSCESCHGRGVKTYSWSLEQIAEALRPLLEKKKRRST